MKLLLFILVSFLAVSATLTGFWLISNPDSGILQLPSGLLDGTPFNNFRPPGIFIAVLIGGVNFLAVFLLIKRHSAQYSWALYGGVITVLWLIVQLLLNKQYFLWEMVCLIIGLVIILIAYHLKGKWAV